MTYEMYITERDDMTEGFDVSSLVHDIEYSTSLLAQPGKLTFQLEKDPNGNLKLEVGKRVMFKSDGKGIFNGFIFKLETNSKGMYSVTAYDSLRYFKNHDYKAISEGEYSLADVFADICKALNLEYKIVGYAAIEMEKLHKHAWLDKSYFEILNDCIEEMNQRSVSVRVYDPNGQFLDDAKQYYSEMADMSEEQQKIPRKFFVKDDFGTIVLTDIESNWKIREVSNSFEQKNILETNFAKLANVEINPYIIGEESLLTGYNYTLDIDADSYNEVIFMKNNSGNKKNEKVSVLQAEPSGWKERIKTEHGTTNDGIWAYQEWKAGRYIPGAKTMAWFEDEIEKKINAQLKNSNIQLAATEKQTDYQKKWGVLRHIAILNDGYSEKQLEEYTKLFLSENMRVKKKISLEALGLDGMDAGDGFVFRLKRLGIEAEKMFVISATHHYDADKHTMSLDVCTDDALTETI